MSKFDRSGAMRWLENGACILGSQGLVSYDASEETQAFDEVVPHGRISRSVNLNTDSGFGERNDTLSRYVDIGTSYASENGDGDWNVRACFFFFV
jgi:hypothetical protein